MIGPRLSAHRFHSHLSCTKLTTVEFLACVVILVEIILACVSISVHVFLFL